MNERKGIKINLPNLVPQSLKTVKDPDLMSQIAIEMLQDKLAGTEFKRKEQVKMAYQAHIEALQQGGFQAAGLPHPNSVTGRVDRTLRAISNSWLGKMLHGE